MSRKHKRNDQGQIQLKAKINLKTSRSRKVKKLNFSNKFQNLRIKERLISQM